MKISGAFSLSLGFLVLGGAVGWLTGWSGADRDVLASTLPAVLSLVGAMAGALALRDSGMDDRVLRLAGILLLLFSLFMGLGMHIASIAREAVDRRNYEISKALRSEERTERINSQQSTLRDCARAEVLINESRRQLWLPPLFPEEVCPPHVIWPVPKK